MTKKYNEYLSIFIRYLILILVAIPGLYIFYFIFKPLTLYPSFFFLNIFYEANIRNTTIFVGDLLTGNVVPLEIINACIAGSAYYLLLILNLAVPKIKINKRIKMLVFAFISFLIISLIRIFVLSTMAVSGSSFFDVTHKVFWYAFSILFVVGIWFLEVKLFKIKEIPFYSDLEFLFKKSHLSSKVH